MESNGRTARDGRQRRDRDRDALQSGASDQLAEARTADAGLAEHDLRSYVHIKSSPPVRFIWANYAKTLAVGLQRNYTNAAGKFSLPGRPYRSRGKGVCQCPSVI